MANTNILIGVEEGWQRVRMEGWQRENWIFVQRAARHRHQARHRHCALQCDIFLNDFADVMTDREIVVAIKDIQKHDEIFLLRQRVMPVFFRKLSAEQIDQLLLKYADEYDTHYSSKFWGADARSSKQLLDKFYQDCPVEITEKWEQYKDDQFEVNDAKQGLVRAVQRDEPAAMWRYVRENSAGLVLAVQRDEPAAMWRYVRGMSADDILHVIHLVRFFTRFDNFTLHLLWEFYVVDIQGADPERSSSLIFAHWHSWANY